MQSQCFIQVDSFKDFARYVCAFREHPLRVYSHELEKTRILSSGIVLSNTVVWFYIPNEKSGRYISYNSKGGKESCDIVDTTKEISTYAPIVNLESKLSPLKTKTQKIPDQFHPIKVKDIGSLARLTYDPELPDEPNLALYLVPLKKKWLLGYITSIQLDDFVYCFNYVELDEAPQKPFLKYSGKEGRQPEFSDTFQHGYPYLPIIKIKENHSIFGLE